MTVWSVGRFVTILFRGGCSLYWGNGRLEPQSGGLSIRAKNRNRIIAAQGWREESLELLFTGNEVEERQAFLFSATSNELTRLLNGWLNG